jgi:hypothetical protein
MGQAMTIPRFFEELRSEQDRARQQADYLAQARGRGRAPARRKRTPWLAWGGAFAAAAGVALALGPWLKSPTFLVGNATGTVGAFIAAPLERELPLVFEDGTRVALGAGTSARVVSIDEHGAHIVLEKGSARASVVHRADSQWRLDVGPFQVAVVGTRFDASWDAAVRVLELRLDQGAVLVSGAFLRDALSVRAGQTLRAYADDARVEVSGPELSASSPGTAPERVAPPVAEAPRELLKPASKAPSVETTPSEATWQSLASSGKFREALAVAEKSGFDRECQRASGADALALGDAARLSGAAARATQAYGAARSKLPGGGRASYGLGLVAFDQLGDFASAARWFETYLREQPSGTLRAEATGRLLEALHRSGQASKARSVASQYLTRYPNGAQAALAKKLTSPQ